MNDLHKQLKLSTKKLKKMNKGESCVFVENTTSNPGKASQSKACGCGIKIKTEKCLVIGFKPSRLIDAVIVTKLNWIKLCSINNNFTVILKLTVHKRSGQQKRKFNCVLGVYQISNHMVCGLFGFYPATRNWNEVTCLRCLLKRKTKWLYYHQGIIQILYNSFPYISLQFFTYINSIPEHHP